LLILSHHEAQMATKLHKNGKLLLTGEYAVLDGALALAIPTKFGQTFHIEQHQNSESLVWQAFDDTAKLWFEAELNLVLCEIISTNDQDLAQALLKVLNAALGLNPDFIHQTLGTRVESRLDFPRTWGLGSSSTLIAAVAQWSETDPFNLSSMSFGGSGYDVAAANMAQAFTYKIGHLAVEVNPVTINWPFKEHLYFIHRNQKQNSRESITDYRKKTTSTGWIQEITALTQAIIGAQSAGEFAKLIQQHEQMIAKTLGVPPIKEELFSDFPGVIKSLGGWGGDFIMALGPEVANNSKALMGSDQTVKYFNAKGYQTVIAYNYMILTDF